MKVVELGPQFEKKKVSEYMMNMPACACVHVMCMCAYVVGVGVIRV